jgi:hypothetical protein
MTIKELIEVLEKIRAEYGDDIQSVVSIDTDDAFNITTCTEIDVVFTNSGERKVAFCGSLESKEEE